MLIMVVDDERWARKDLVRAIRQAAGAPEWDYSEQIAVEEAANGEEAWKMIRQRPPDLLITDIRMPRMDGLQLIANVKEQFPHVVCLIASGYDDFSYARQGIKYGVREYLLKPVREADLAVLLNQIFREFKSMLRRKLFHWLNGKSETEIPPGRNWQGSVAIIAVLIGNWHSDDTLSYIDGMEGYQCQPDDQPNMIVHLRALSSSDSAQETRQLAFNLAVQWLGWRTEPMVHAAYGIVESWSELPGEYARLRQRLQAALQLERRQIVHPEWQKAGVPDLNEIWSRVRFVELAMRSGARSELHDKWEAVFRYLQRMSLTQEQLGTILIDILVGLSFHQSGLSMIRTADLLAKQREVQTVVTYGELYKLTLGWLEEMQYEAVHHMEGKSAKQLLPVIVKDLQARYGENIRLKQVAESYGIHPTHLSRLFKEEYGMNFVDFMSDLRLRKAQELLRETTFKPSEIAVTVGFADAKYFGAWFVKLTGMSPSAYRKSVTE